MKLHHASVQFLVYLKALGLSAKRLNSYQRALADIELFYGPDAPLSDFDNTLVLEYVKENDPFETDPVKVERGALFCKFTHWLMKNRLIPAWADEMERIEKDQRCFYANTDDSQVSDYLIL